MTPSIFARTALPLALAASLAWAPDAHADDVTDKAEQGLAELRFDDARSLASEALAEGTRGPDTLVTLHMILGQVAASLGEEAEAEKHFRAALSIDSSASLPDGVSPKLSEPFSKAQSAVEGAKPIKLLAEVDDQGQLSVQVASDPAKLVRGAEAHYLVDGKAKTQRGKGTDIVRLDLPPNASELQVAPIDEYGNRLGELMAIGKPAGAVTSEPPTVDIKTSPSTPIYQRWQLYAGVAVGTLATGAYFGNASQAKTDEITQLEDGTEFSVAQSLEDQARSRALFANISFAATGVFGAAAVWMYLREGSSDKEKPETALVPMLGAGRVGVAASGHF